MLKILMSAFWGVFSQQVAVGLVKDRCYYGNLHYHDQPVAKSVQCDAEEKDSRAITNKTSLIIISDWRRTNKDIHKLECTQRDLALLK